MPVPGEEILQTVTLEDGTEVEIRALTPAEAARVKPNFFTWDEMTARTVAAIAIVKPSGILERELSSAERERIFRATGSAWLQGRITTKRSVPSPAGQSSATKETRWISPSFRAEKLHGANDTIENRIAVYEDRLRGWLVRWAEHLNDVRIDERRHAGFAVVQLALAYFEPLTAFLRGQDTAPKKAAEFFRAGVLEVFPELAGDDDKDSILEILCKDARTRLFHDGVALKRLRLEDDPDGNRAFRYDAAARVLSVCRHNLVRRIAAHLDRYVERLRDPSQGVMRGNFQKAWEAIHGSESWRPGGRSGARAMPVKPRVAARKRGSESR
jgi:hypothetical protein